MSGRVSVPWWHATPVANAPWKPLIIGEGQARYQGHEIGGEYFHFALQISGNCNIIFNTFQLPTDRDIEMRSTGDAEYTEPNSNPYESELRPTEAEIHAYDALGQDDSCQNDNGHECNPYETEEAKRDNDEHPYKELD